jgi:hypothetical protein
MAITQLDAVNDMLGLLGELPVNDLEQAHPLVPSALRYLNQANTTYQSKKMWFNVEYPTLTPQTDGKIMVPNDTASVDSLTEYPRLAVRGRFLYNLDAVTGVFSEPIKVRLHRIVPFEDAPISVRALVSAQASLAFSRNYDGDPVKTSEVKQELAQHIINVNTESIRNAKANLFRRSGVARIMSEMQQGMHRPRYR